MSRRKITENHIRKLQGAKGSYLISLPIAEIRGLGWREGQKVTIKRRGKGFVVQDWKEKK